MRRKGSITVFLALVLVLLFSLVLTTLEAARLAGGRAYVQMLSYMAGDSARALYYYPLFEEYGLLGVLAEDAEGYFSEEKLQKTVTEDLKYALAGLKGGLLSFSEPKVEVEGTTTLLSDGAQVFLEQVKAQAALEGAWKLLSQLPLKQEMGDAVHASQIYKKQEEAISRMATVTQEFLKLMELIDGVETDEEGLCFDEEGRLKTRKVFIKRVCSLSKEELSEQYKTKEVYLAIKDCFYSPKEHAENLFNLLKEGAAVQAEIAVCDLELKSYREHRSEIAEMLLTELPEQRANALLEELKVLAKRIEETTEYRDERIEWLDIAQMDMEEQYETLRTELSQVIPLLIQAEEILTGLESKQLGAQLSVKNYEEFLQGVREEISEELFTVFEDELERLKLYAGLSESGYQVSDMRATIENNKRLLKALLLPEFDGDALYEMSLCVERVAEGIGGYSVEGLWFTYGTIAAPQTVKGNVFEMIENIAMGSILSLAGLSKEELSDGRLMGQNLPSAALTGERLQTQLSACFDEVAKLFRTGGVLGILTEGAESATELLALEWYVQNYFGRFGGERQGTRLSYEREYLLFGDRSDRGNLFFTVLYLVAIRSIFAMTAILKDPMKMGQLETFSIGVAGFTGMPVLISAVKYGALFLWSIEEAFVEVAVLLDGKKVPIVNPAGTIDFAEMFLFGSAMVEKKAKEWAAGATGFDYEEYLTILSLLKDTGKKEYRCMDLIQENIRSRFRDSFRIKNVVTGFTFRVDTTLKQSINSELWGENEYEISMEEAVVF